MGVPIGKTSSPEKEVLLEFSLIERRPRTWPKCHKMSNNIQQHDKVRIPLGFGIAGDTESITKQYRTPSQPMVTLGLRRAAHLRRLGPQKRTQTLNGHLSPGWFTTGIPWCTHFWRMPNLSLHVGSPVRFSKVALRMFVQQGFGTAMSPVMILALALLPSFSSPCFTTELQIQVLTSLIQWGYKLNPTIDG